MKLSTAPRTKITVRTLGTQQSLHSLSSLWSSASLNSVAFPNVAGLNFIDYIRIAVEILTI